jgi:predicted transcriptional regulator
MATPVNSLRTLCEGKAEGITKTTTFRVDPDLIQFEEGFNLRSKNKELEEHVERLYLAMKEGAFIPPIDVTVETGTIICRDGHCRTRAGQRLKLEVPEFTLEARQLRGNETDAVLHMLGSGTGGMPLTPLEQGKGYLRLLKMGLFVEEIAKKLGVSRVTVDKGVTLAEAPVKIQNMVASGAVSSTVAIDAIKQGKEGMAALEEAVTKHQEVPTKTKKGKVKKVTAKTLRGTKADKKSNVKKEVVAATPADSVTVTLKRDAAVELVEFISTLCNPVTDPKVEEAKVAIETTLL